MSPANPDTVNSRKKTLRGTRLMESWLVARTRHYTYAHASVDENRETRRLGPGAGGAVRLPERADHPGRGGRRRPQAEHVPPGVLRPDGQERGRRLRQGALGCAGQEPARPGPRPGRARARDRRP